MPTYVGNGSAQAGSTNQISITYTPSVGDTLLLGVSLNDGTESVSQVYDNVGLDIYGNPINEWQNLGTVNINNGRLELWGCLTIITAPTTINVLLTGSQAGIMLNLLEYSGVASFGNSGSVSNTGYSNLFFQGVAQNNTDIMVAMFGLPSSTNADNVTSGSGTYGIPNQANFVITPATIRQNLTLIAGMQSVAMEQTVINIGQLIVAEIISTGIPLEGYFCVGVILQGGFALITPPGFSDIDETQLTAGTIVHALKMNQIAQNAALGMVRPEFFYGLYVDGDTVDVPVSPVDQYQYSRDELIYIFTPFTTFDVQSGWTSASGILFYCLWDIDSVTGDVTCNEYYHPDGNSPVAKTSDGQLVVLTIAQRGNSGSTSSSASGVVMSTPPSLSNVDLTLCGEDKPLTQTLVQTLAKNSKFAAVKAEVFYCGEFVNGQTVAAPISAVDGYQYSYNEVKFMSSWKWNTFPDAFGPPPMATADGGNADGGWSQLNYMTAQVSADGVVSCDVYFYNHNNIDPSASPNGGVAFGRLKVFAFCQRNKGLYFGIPALTASTGSISPEQTITAKLTAPSGTTTGNLTITLQAAATIAATIDAATIRKCLTGSTTVLSTTSFLFSGSGSATIGAGTSLQSDALSAYTLDDAHDYYISFALTGGLSYTALAGLINSNTPLISTVVAGDHTADSTVSFTSSVTNWNGLAAIQITIVGDTVADEFFEIPITKFVPGQPLTEEVVTQLAQNVKEGCYAVEFFGPTNHVNGDTISLPTSPTDGYNYTREELLYIWQWHTTGNPVIRLWGWGASISALGVVDLFVYHVQDGGPVAENNSGASLDVITIGVRNSISTATTAPLNGTNPNPPTDVSVLALGGTGGYTVNGNS